MTNIKDTNIKESATIWASMKAWVKADPQSGKQGNREIIELVILDRDFISGCSPEIKTIIAFYSRLYLTEESEALANDLGEFSTLKEAQDCLLEDKEQYFSDVKKQDYLNGIFEIEIKNDIVFAKLRAMTGSYTGSEKFRIHENGDIEYLQ